MKPEFRFFDTYVLKFKDEFEEETGKLTVDGLNSKYSIVFIVLNDGKYDEDTNRLIIYNLETGNIVKYLNIYDGIIYNVICVNQEYCSDIEETFDYTPTWQERRKALKIYKRYLAMEQLEKEKKLVKYKGKIICEPE